MQSTDKPDSNNTKPPVAKKAPGQINYFASVKLTVLCLGFIATTVLVGAWCPQEAQGGKEKVVEMFGAQNADLLIKFGVSDIFHSPWFLFLIALLTVNMVACSFQRVFPKIRTLKMKMPFLKGKEISKLPYTRQVVVGENSSATISSLASLLKKRGFQVTVDGSQLTGEFGKYGRLAASVTHVGLLTLLAGVTVSSWTGFSGFQPIRPGETMSFGTSEHSKLWIGKLPTWGIRVDGTRRENHPSGDPKQWYSELAVVDEKGKVLKKQEISVNNPLSYDGVDIYQSSWGLDEIRVAFNGHIKALPLQTMGKRYAAFLPLDQESIMIFSILDQTSPMRVFAKRAEWQAPKMISELKSGKSATLGAVEVTYVQAIPVTGLQYKCDPGIPIVYTAFGFIMLGVMMAAIPHRHVWASVESEKLFVGGKSYKAKVGFERMMEKLVKTGFGEPIEVLVQESSDASDASAVDAITNTKPDLDTIPNTADQNDSAKDLANVIGSTVASSSRGEQES